MDSYFITYSFTFRDCPGEGGNGTVAFLNGSSREYTLTGLQENSDYNVSIRAGNGKPTFIIVSTLTDGMVCATKFTFR